MLARKLKCAVNLSIGIVFSLPCWKLGSLLENENLKLDIDGVTIMNVLLNLDEDCV